MAQGYTYKVTGWLLRGTFKDKDVQLKPSVAHDVILSIQIIEDIMPDTTCKSSYHSIQLQTRPTYYVTYML